MEDLGARRHQAMTQGQEKIRPGAKHLGLGVVAVMSVKGTATLTAAYLLPSWPLRFLALAIIVAIGTFGVVRHRRARRARDTEGAR